MHSVFDYNAWPIHGGTSTLVHLWILTEYVNICALVPNEFLKNENWNKMNNEENETKINIMVSNCGKQNWMQHENKLKKCNGKSLWYQHGLIKLAMTKM